MYEDLMEEVVSDVNVERALGAVKRNGGAPGMDGMEAGELAGHLQRHWPAIRAKLLKGTYAVTPVRRVEIPKPNGGMRQLGIPTVLDRFIQHLLLQVLTPIFDPEFSEHSYGFRPGRRAHDAVRAAREYAVSGKDWVVDLDIEKFLDHASYCTHIHERPSKSDGFDPISLIRNPLRLPERTWTAESSPRLTRCNTV
jgi:RNA-directed DNA polymerase